MLKITDGDHSPRSQSIDRERECSRWEGYVRRCVLSWEWWRGSCGWWERWVVAGQRFVRHSLRKKRRVGDREVFWENSLFGHLYLQYGRVCTEDRSSILFHANLDCVDARGEDLCRRFSMILLILPPVFTVSFLHSDITTQIPITSRLWSSQILPKVYTHTKRYCSFIQYVLTTTSKPTFLPWSLFDYLSYY